MPYQRFDNGSGLLTSSTHTFIDDSSLFNSTDNRQANLWNKGEKLTSLYKKQQHKLQIMYLTSIKFRHGVCR